MNNPMMAALKSRRGGLMSHEGQHVEQPSDEGGKDLHGLVASLNPHEKEALKSILDKDKGQNGMAVSKGEPSSQEHKKIAEASAQEQTRQSAEEASEQGEGQIDPNDSDEIAKSMLDSRHMRGMATEKPRNLGERMKQSLTSKLKAKGKI